MPKRNPESYEARRQQIIDGALRVFSTKGFLAATNKDVAEAAGINSPALIYHYFDSKEDLLRAVVEIHAAPMKLLTQTDSLMAMPPAQVLTLFGRAFLDMMEDPKMTACMRVLIGEAMRSPEFAEILGNAGVLRIRRLLADYIQHQMDEGVLRAMDPLVAAHCFMGPFQTYAMMRIILRLPGSPPIDPESLVAAQVDIFLRALQV